MQMSESEEIDWQSSQVTEVLNDPQLNSEKNPLYTIWCNTFGEVPYNSRSRFDWEIHNKPGAFDFVARHAVREETVHRYAWAVPSPGIIEAIADVGISIVEIGAGTGYWAKQLRDAGVDVIAYDQNPPSPQTADNHWHPNVECWTEVLRGGFEKAAEHPDRVLLLVWPPYADSMAADALRAFAGAGGNKLIYIGEGWGGCTGDDQFHDDLEKWWTEFGSLQIPQWEGIHDYASFYVHNRPLELSHQ